MEKIDINQLTQKLPYQWKVQSVPKGWKTGQDLDKKASCVAYIDARDVQNLLDKVVWPENWSSDFYEAKGKLFCKIGIRMNGEWIYKSDSGALEGSDFVEAETTSKGESSDAFKRAGVMWGIGRFLYDMEIQWIDSATYTKYKYKLSGYINSQWNNTTIRDDVPQMATKPSKPYITGLQVQTMLMDYKEGKIQVASVESLIEKAQKDYVVAQWAKDKFIEGFNSIKK